MRNDEEDARGADDGSCHADDVFTPSVVVIVSKSVALVLSNFILVFFFFP